MPPRQLLATLFGSLGNSRWSLTRTLRSDNPLDINGELRGTATFSALTSDRDWLYSEEGEIPSSVGGAGAAVAGLRWTKKYIWRTNESGRISVWFVKVAPGPEEADYLFHNFDFTESSTSEGQETTIETTPEFVTPPIPPSVDTSDATTVLAAQGNHLCINDMYRTAYAFRIRPETGEVLSWASRHVVKGPKKDQDIVNCYQRLE